MFGKGYFFVLFCFQARGKVQRNVFLLLFITLSEKGLFLLKSVFRCDCVKCGSIVELK